MALDFTPSDVRGLGFRHRVYAAGDDEAADTLHVYVEHDGTPWLDHRYVTADPTPRTPVALELMSRDAGPRVLLGRPCHFEPAADPACGPAVWTHRRYAPEVVDSMVAALRRYLDARRYSRVVLVGYSGGGTLAWLMASRVPETVAVVTLAANLDTGLWTAQHGYTPMAGSLDPALAPALSPRIVEVHYAGGRDRNVPPAVAESFHRRHPASRVVVVDDFDHECCWVARWPELLAGALADPRIKARPAP